MTTEMIQHGLDDSMFDWNGTPRQLWHEITNAMAVQVMDATFKKYFEPLQLAAYDGDTFTAYTEVSKMAWCKQNATNSLKRALKRELERNVAVVFEVKPEAQMSLPMFSLDADGVIEFEELGDEKWWE